MEDEDAWEKLLGPDTNFSFRKAKSVNDRFISYHKGCLPSIREHKPLNLDYFLQFWNLELAKKVRWSHHLLNRLLRRRMFWSRWWTTVPSMPSDWKSSLSSRLMSVRTLTPTNSFFSPSNLIVLIFYAEFCWNYSENRPAVIDLGVGVFLIIF